MKIIFFVKKKNHYCNVYNKKYYIQKSVKYLRCPLQILFAYIYENKFVCTDMRLFKRYTDMRCVKICLDMRKSI